MAELHVQVIASGAAVQPVADTAADVVICADGGLAVALTARRPVDLVVGDFDSARPDDVAAAVAAGADLETHPAGKDESDLELALAAAVERGATALTVHLAEGGRLDHQLANLAVVSSRRWSGVALQAWVGVDRVWAVWDRVELPLAVGRGVAIQAMGGSAQVTTTGLKYPLDQEFLDPGQARGIANVVVSTPASVRVDDGVVLVISPQT